MKYRQDHDGVLKEIAEDLINKYEDFEHLKDVNILFLWVSGWKQRPGEKRILGQARLADRRLRDVFGYDAIIEINEDVWPELTKRQRRKLVFHELCHLGKRVNKAGEVSLTIIKHDFELARFRREIEVFGLDHDEEDFRAFLNAIKEKKTRKKTRKNKNKNK